MIFMTALADIESKIKGFDVGTVDYITKPLEEKEVLARVQIHLTIRDQQKQLQELNASKDKFFSIIAHDLRGPLNSLRLLTQATEEHFDSYEPGKLKEIITLQRTSIDNLCTLLENLLTWSRIQRGMIEYHPQPINIGKIVARIIALLTPNAEQKQITLRSLISENVFVYADLHMVETVVRSLLSNALKFTNTHGTVEVSATQGEYEVEVAVSDTGIGISEKVLPKPFWIDATYHKRGTVGEKGTGLGLILCKEFVAKNGGRIWVKSEVGKGTTFFFTLPKESLES